MTEKRRCCLCESRVIERTIRAGDRTLYLCPLHGHLDDTVVRLALQQTKRKVTA